LGLMSFSMLVAAEAPEPSWAAMVEIGSSQPSRTARIVHNSSLLRIRPLGAPRRLGQPRASSEGFEPSTGGIAAALPNCDRFIAAHSARLMHAVIQAITAT
jgi:hypothetical protein